MPVIDSSVQSGCYRLDEIEQRGNLGVFLACDRAGDEDSKVADELVHAIDDGLASGFYVVLIAIDIGDPTQCLRGRGDIVAF